MQKPGKAGCFDATEEDCTRLSLLDFPNTITISPDGLNVYVTTDTNEIVVIFDRDATGALRTKAGRDVARAAEVARVARRIVSARALRPRVVSARAAEGRAASGAASCPTSAAATRSRPAAGRSCAGRACACRGGAADAGRARSA